MTSQSNTSADIEQFTSMVMSLLKESLSANIRFVDKIPASRMALCEDYIKAAARTVFNSNVSDDYEKDDESNCNYNNNNEEKEKEEEWTSTPPSSPLTQSDNNTTNSSKKRKCTDSAVDEENENNKENDKEEPFCLNIILTYGAERSFYRIPDDLITDQEWEDLNSLYDYTFDHDKPTEVSERIRHNLEQGKWKMYGKDGIRSLAENDIFVLNFMETY
jgi:hypothetical protein